MAQRAWKSRSRLSSRRIITAFIAIFPWIIPAPADRNYTLFIKVLSVTDDSGDKLKVEKKTSNGFLHLKIYVPGAVDATRTVNIEYSVANGTRFFEDHDEFYWNVTGNDWPVPIEQASATIYFPPETSGKLRAQAFEGIYGSSAARFCFRHWPQRHR